MFAKLENLERKYEELEQQIASPEVLEDQERYRKLTKAHSDLKEVVDVFREYKDAEASLAANQELAQDPDPEMRLMVQEENAILQARLP